MVSIFLELTDVSSVFLDDDVYLGKRVLFESDLPISNATSLGFFTDDCIRDVTLCRDGVTWLLRFDVTLFNPFQAPRYFLFFQGVYVRQNFGLQFEIHVTNQSHSWSSLIDLIPDTYNVTLAFSFRHHLTVYFDGLVVGDTPPSTKTTDTSNDVEPSTEIWLGKIPDGIAAEGELNADVLVRELSLFEHELTSAEVESIPGNLFNTNYY